MVSGFLRESTRVIADAPGVARNADGPLASAELFVIINLPKRSTGTDANVPMRGVERAALKVRDKLKLVEGRMFEWGKNEVIVGVGAASEFAGLGARRQTARRAARMAHRGDLFRRRRQRGVRDLDRRDRAPGGL